ncbi:MAG: DUF1640 domain-containing protein [Acidobacteria bacterium]|nr:DUF1640 domain-containing protein [Acidobacteriota bacterium]MYI75024.1 DUF1640 domain-containing protein [Acidobacteriota bacterium]
MSTRFDTLQAAEALADAGFDEAQAKAIVSTMSNAVGEHVATKADLGALRVDFADLRAEVRTEIAELKASLTWRIVLALSAFAALTRLMP